MEIISFFLVVIVCSLFLFLYLKWYKTYVLKISKQLEKYNLTKDCESIIKLRKKYRRREYITSILISIVILIILIPIAVYLRSIFDDKFYIGIAISSVSLVFVGFTNGAKAWMKRYKLDGQNPNNLKKGTFVIYLRAFNDDDTPWSSEDLIVKAFAKNIPVYKIGKPSEIELGESEVIKFYETDMSWKEQISLAKENSKFIILSLNGTDGLIWEFLDTKKYKDKILYVVERRDSFTQFCIRYKQYTSFSFDFSIPLQQDYPCFFWFNSSNIEIHSLSKEVSVSHIIKQFIKYKGNYGVIKSFHQSPRIQI